MATGKEIMNTTVVATIIIVMVVISALIVGTLTSNSVFTDITATGSVTNETDGFINETGYALAQSSLSGFSLTSIVILDADDNSTIGAGNYTVTSGVITNATTQDYVSILISYEYTYSTGSNLAGVNVSQVSNDFGSFVTNLIVFLAIIGIIIGVTWLVYDVRKLLDKKQGIQGITA